MFPKYNFDDSLAAIERLGKKKEMNIHMVRYRMDQLTKDDERNLLDVPEDLEEMHVTRDEPADEFDALIDEQIALTTAHSRMHATNVSDRSFDNISGIASQYNNSISSTPAPQTFTSITQPLSSPQTSQISEETRARIAENRLRALAIFEQKKKEAEIKQQQEKMEIEKSADTPKNISIYIDDDDF